LWIGGGLGVEVEVGIAGAEVILWDCVVVVVVVVVVVEVTRLVVVFSSNHPHHPGVWNVDVRVLVFVEEDDVEVED
jgi:hypothetical protein